MKHQEYRVYKCGYLQAMLVRIMYSTVESREIKSHARVKTVVSGLWEVGSMHTVDTFYLSRLVEL